MTKLARELASLSDAHEAEAGEFRVHPESDVSAWEC